MRHFSSALIVTMWTISFAMTVVVATVAGAKTAASMSIGLTVLVSGAVVAAASGLYLAAGGGKLVTSGPYRFFRHPVYAGLLLMLGGAVITMNSWQAAFLLCPCYLLTIARARSEERELASVYKDEYCRYRRQTGFGLWWH